MSNQIEFYRFAQSGQVWTYTSGDTPVEHNGETYTPAPIERSQIEQSNEINRSNLSITLPRTNALAAEFLTDTSDFITSVTLYRQIDGSTVVLWKGRVASAKASISEVTIECESIFTSLRRPGLRARYQRACRHTLYGRGCNVDKTLFALTGIVDAVTDAVITVPEAAGQADGYFTGGMMETYDGIARWITQHSGTSITLSRPIPGFADRLTETGWGLSWGKYWNGQVGVILYPGCDRTRQTCNDRFNNINNFGGFSWIPRRNPFDGNSIV